MTGANVDARCAPSDDLDSCIVLEVRVKEDRS